MSRSFIQNCCWV